MIEELTVFYLSCSYDILFSEKEVKFKQNTPSVKKSIQVLQRPCLKGYDIKGVTKASKFG